MSTMLPSHLIPDFDGHLGMNEVEVDITIAGVKRQSNDTAEMNSHGSMSRVEP